MGGDSVITHEFSDRLAEDLMNERFTALVSDLEENGKRQYLTSEWVSAMFKLRQEEMFHERPLYTPDMYAFAVKESEKMQQLDWLGGMDIRQEYEKSPHKLYIEAHDMYYSHSGIHSMAHRRDRLAVAAEIFSYKLEASDPADGFLARQTANAYEELAFYDMLSGTCTEHLDRARLLNEMVVTETKSWHYPYRIHALMSLLDLKATELLSALKFTDSKTLTNGLKHIHMDFNQALIFIAEQMDAYADVARKKLSKVEPRFQKQAANHWLGHLLSASGVLAEGLAMSVVQDHILDQGLGNRYWVRQAFLREDSMAGRRLSQDQGSELLDVPNLSFDLQIYDYASLDGGHVPIEVKKATNPSPSSLHPDIKVITFKDNSQTQSFTRTVKSFAQSQIEKYASERRPRQSRIHKEITHRVEPGRLFVNI
jgi:hypothetical protein